jgi:hypothetical protein
MVIWVLGRVRADQEAGVSRKRRKKKMRSGDSQCERESTAESDLDEDVEDRVRGGSEAGLEMYKR